MARTRMARYRGWFELFFQSLQDSSNSSRKIFMDFFLFYHGIVCCMYSLESPHRGDSNEYTQHTIIVYKIEKISLNYRYLLPELVPWLTVSGSNYPCLERISMVPKMFEPLRFDCMYYTIYSLIRLIGYKCKFLTLYAIEVADDDWLINQQFSADYSIIYFVDYLMALLNVSQHIWQSITKTRLYNFDPLKPHFYKVKLGFRGVYIIFLISAQKHRLWVLVWTASRVPTIYILSRNMKHIRVFYLKIFSFWRWNFLYIWIGVFS